MNNKFSKYHSVIDKKVTEKTIIKEGDLFIIPNELIKFSNMVPSEKERVKAEWEKTGVYDKTYFVQVWATNSECNNWYAHRIEKTPGSNDGKESWEYIFPGIMPVEIFHHHKEGDVLELYNEPEDVLFKLTLCQAKHRYNEFGLFHEILDSLQMKAYFQDERRYSTDLSLQNDKTIVLEGDVFIVPNQAGTAKDYIMYSYLQDTVTAFQCGLSEKLIEIWATSPDCDNWHCHYKDYEGRTAKGILFPTYIPLSYLDGKKEGDVLEFIRLDENVLFRLKCNQLDYRYRNHGKFEDVLSRVSR